MGLKMNQKYRNPLTHDLLYYSQIFKFVFIVLLTLNLFTDIEFLFTSLSDSRM